MWLHRGSSLRRALAGARLKADPMPRVFLFLSTGRCGTQWLASALGDLYGDRAEVEHEPLGPDYRPRRFLRSYERLDEMLEVPAIRDHLRRVERTIEERPYIETGWPCYAAVPLFSRIFGDRLSLVRILRHPVPTAVSLVTHGFWSGRADAYATEAILDPWSEGVVQSDYARRWRDMSPYEKCLFWWTELHLYADELSAGRFEGPFLDIRFEDLFDESGTALDELVSFLGLPSEDSLARATGRRKDDRRRRTNVPFSWREIFDHPGTLAVAERHGYRVRWQDDLSLRERYGMAAPSSWLGRSFRRARRLLGRTRRSR